jgi:hypothetical protein
MSPTPLPDTNDRDGLSRRRDRARRAWLAQQADNLAAAGAQPLTFRHGRHVGTSSQQPEPGTCSYRACNQYPYSADVKHNTAVWVLVWLFVAAWVAAIVNVAVVTRLP